MAGRGDFPETHVTIAQKFLAPTCIDISHKAIEIAKRKLKHKGEYIIGSILSIPKSENYFDAAYCAHVIYHIDRDLQERAVRELIRVIRPGGRIVIIYSNPHSLPARLIGWKGKMVTGLVFKTSRTAARVLMWRKKRKESPDKIDTQKRPPLYFFAHPLNWWTQFDNECDLELIPWDVMGNTQEKQILMNDAIAWLVYRFCSWFENKYPKKAVQWWSYPVIVLTKKSFK